ncbi:UNVERIFIED_CONTAM: hypothetical protein FKN15_044750 [Acipenser sinensis]
MQELRCAPYYQRLEHLLANEIATYILMIYKELYSNLSCIRMWWDHNGTGPDEQTAVAIASVQQATAFADHNIQYQFRTENNGGQVTYRVVQVTDGQLDGQTDATGAVSVVSTAAFTGGQQAVAQMDGPRTPRDERRRAQHNEVERRRRDKINNWIVTLSKIIPDCNTDSSKTGASKGGILSKACDYIRELRQTNQRLQESFKEVERVQMDNELIKQQSKGGILSKACDYIRELRQTNQRLQESFKEVERVQMDNELIKQQIEEMKNENALLRAQLQQHGISMGETSGQ